MEWVTKSTSGYWYGYPYTYTNPQITYTSGGGSANINTTGLLQSITNTKCAHSGGV